MVSIEKKKKNMKNNIGHYAMWREMDCAVKIVGVADSINLSGNNTRYIGMKDIIDNGGMPLIPNENIVKEKYVYIVELPEAVDVKMDNERIEKTKIIFLPKKDLSSPIHPDLIEKIEKQPKKLS